MRLRRVRAPTSIIDPGRFGKLLRGNQVASACVIATNDAVHSRIGPKKNSIDVLSSRLEKKRLTALMCDEPILI